MSEKRYFTVSVSCRLGNGNYVPGVCYELTSAIEEVVEKLASEGRAKIYDEEIRMVSGRAVPVSRTFKPAASVQTAEGSRAVSAVSASVPEYPGQSTQVTETTQSKSSRKNRNKRSGIKF